MERRSRPIDVLRPVAAPLGRATKTPLNRLRHRVSLQNAASIAGLLLATDAAIVDIKEKKKGGGGGHGHGGGMDEMDY
jgi:hypothetical protein